jgi:pimeloyl-ACP methyl ester carboxylesterase
LSEGEARVALLQDDLRDVVLKAYRDAERTGNDASMALEAALEEVKSLAGEDDGLRLELDQRFTQVAMDVQLQVLSEAEVRSKLSARGRAMQDARLKDRVAHEELSPVIQGADSADVGEQGEARPVDEEDEVRFGTLDYKRRGRVSTPAGPGRPLLLYIPGVDMMEYESARQFDGLSENFDAWMVLAEGGDRSKFSVIVASVIEFLRSKGVSKEQPCLLVGSSFGSIAAFAVALEVPDLVKGVTAINPATSYERSAWPIVGNFLSLAPSPEAFGVAAASALIATLPDSSKTQEVMDKVSGKSFQEQAALLFEEFAEYQSLIQDVLQVLSPDSLRFRLKNWLKDGARFVNPRLKNLQVPVLVLAGEEDRMLPSTEEADRLQGLIPMCEVEILPRVGHAPLLNPDVVDLADIISRSPFMASSDTRVEVEPGAVKRAKDPVRDFVLDMESPDFLAGKRQYEQFYRLTSPVMLSIDETGQLRRGLAGIPANDPKRPLLFVGNHQLFGLDLCLIVGELLFKRNILARGLAHPVAMLNGADIASALARNQVKAARKSLKVGDSEGDGSRGSDPVDGYSAADEDSDDTALSTALKDLGLNNLAQYATKGRLDGVTELGFAVAQAAFRRPGESEGDASDSDSARAAGQGRQFEALGAVMVSPINFYKLLQKGDAALLFPGGAREALHGADEKYELFWPEKSEFVRMAAQFNATIVPFSAIGMADSLVPLVDDASEVPLFKEQMKEFMANAPKARMDGSDASRIPLVAPGIPARNYFLFGEPLPTEHIDPNDKEATEELYLKAKANVGDGIQYLLKARTVSPSGLYISSQVVFDRSLTHLSPSQHVRSLIHMPIRHPGCYMSTSMVSKLHHSRSAVSVIEICDAPRGVQMPGNHRK